jgi:hypothetical protein
MLCVWNTTDRELGFLLPTAMPRLLPSDKCPKCKGPLTRRMTMVGTNFACDTCDKDDPMKAAEPWIKGELKPPK